MAREGGCPLPHSACCDFPGRRGGTPTAWHGQCLVEVAAQGRGRTCCFLWLSAEVRAAICEFLPCEAALPGPPAGGSRLLCRRVCLCCWRLWVVASPATSLGSGENPGSSTAMRSLGCWGLGVCRLLSVCQSSYACSVHKAWRFWLLPPGGMGRSVSTPSFCKRCSCVALL